MKNTIIALEEAGLRNSVKISVGRCTGNPT